MRKTSCWRLIVSHERSQSDCLCQTNFKLDPTPIWFGNTIIFKKYLFKWPDSICWCFQEYLPRSVWPAWTSSHSQNRPSTSSDNLRPGERQSHDDFESFFSFKSDFQTHERKPSTKYLCSHSDRMLTVSHLKIIVYVLCIPRQNIYGDLAESKPKADGKRSSCCRKW